MLLFQRINWQRWGPTVHVSEQIVWISMLLDLLFFFVIASAVGAAARLVPRISAIRVAVLLLTALAVYDWLVLTGRLRHLGCVLLAIGVGVAFRRWFDKHQAAVLQFWKRTLPWVVAAGVLALIGIEGGRWLSEHRALARLPGAAPNSPNVLVIVVDTLRADHLSSYGYGRPTSPVIDRLGRQGMLFEQAFSTTSWSFPSHVSLLTGRYQFEHGMEKVGPLPVFGSAAPSFGGYPTLGEELEQRGYRTGAFSANRTYFTSNLGFGRGFTHFEDYFHSPADGFLRTTYGKEFARLCLNHNDKSAITRSLRFLGLDALFDKESSEEHAVRKRADVVNQELLKWIDGGRAQRPFFAFLNYFDVHSPYGGPPSYPKPGWPQTGAIDRYDDGVKYADDSIGHLMAELEKRGLGRKTLVVITSDHGEALGQHSLRSHGKTLYVEEIRVPLIFWYPGHIPAATRLPTPITNASLPALVMDVLGAKTPSPFPGPALAALLRGHQAKVDWPFPLSELSQNQYVSKEDDKARNLVPTATSGPMKSLITAQWHLIVHKTLGTQLYDWIHDPGETNNLIRTPAGQEAARWLTSQMQDLLAGSAAASGRETSAVALHNGRLVTAHELLPASGPASPVDDYYSVKSEAGSRLTFEVQTLEAAGSRLDPVVAITDANGDPFQTCRNPGDDDIQSPGVADPTPDAFDDICMNDDINPGVETNSRLEILVPGSSGSPVELTVRVSDWNGRADAGMRYQIAVRGDKEASSTIKASVQ